MAKKKQVLTTDSFAKKFDDLFAAVESDCKVAIFTHKAPDPDAMGSAVGIQWLLAKKYSIESDIFYEGEVSHQQNKTMVNQLEIRMRKADEYKEDDFQKTIIVDATTRNTPLKASTVTIDHHRIDENGAELVINEPVGAASTIVSEIIRSLGVCFVDDVDERIATSLFLGIRVDTEELIGETTTDRDYEASKVLGEHLDRKKLATVIKYPLPAYYFELERVLNTEGNSQMNVSTFVGSIGVISQAKRDALPMLADKMVRMDGVQTAIIFGMVNNGIDVSVRSHNTSLDVNEFCQRLFGKDNAGGKLGIGGAFVPLGILGYDNLEQEFAKELWEVQKKTLFYKILHITSGN